MNPYELDIAAYLNRLKERSKCLDKQVACCIVNPEGRIIASGVNEILLCDKNCHDKENRTCEVRHAEITACNNLRYDDLLLPLKIPFTAYVNLFPCVPCQKFMAQSGVTEIVVFGPRHKDQWFENIRLERDIYADLIQSNGEAKALSVAQGELAELITAISDYFYRPDKLVPPHDVIDEIIDVELMVAQVKKILWKREPETYNILREMRKTKFRKLLQMMDDGEI